MESLSQPEDRVNTRELIPFVSDGQYALIDMPLDFCSLMTIVMRCTDPTFVIDLRFHPAFRSSARFSPGASVRTNNSAIKYAQPE